MTDKEVFKFALIGITVEIEQLEKDIKQGYKFIKQIDNGEKVKTPKTKYEILDIIQKKEEEMKDLEKKKFAIKWQLEVEQ